MVLQGAEFTDFFCHLHETKHKERKVLRALVKDMIQNMKLILMIFDFTSKKSSIMQIIGGEKLNPKKRVLIPILDSIAE